MTTYTTVQGDMWDSIAKAQYGDTKFTDVLINANAQYREIFIFSSGIVLDIPEVNDKVTADDLPPWKQVNG